MTPRTYGWRKDLPDFRDVLHAPAMAATPIPAHSDLRPGCPPVYDQGGLGSCVYNTGCAAFEYDLIEQGLTDFVPSRLQAYYNGRALHGWENEDSGGFVRDVGKVFSHQGVCAEKLWPYVESRVFKKPSKSAAKAALANRVVEYARVPQTHDAIRRTLSTGRPVMFGFTVFESFESQHTADTGFVTMPLADESMIGGHAVLLVGHHDASRRYTVRNSWGAEWGDQGYCYMPYDYVESSSYASDFWVLKVVT